MAERDRPIEGRADRGSATGSPFNRKEQTRYNRMLDSLRRDGVIGPCDIVPNLCTMESRSRNEPDLRKVVIAGAQRVDQYGKLACAMCGTIMRPDRSLPIHRQWPPPEGWETMELRDDRKPLKLRHYKMEILFCPEHVAVARTAFVADALNKQSAQLQKDQIGMLRKQVVEKIGEEATAAVDNFLKDLSKLMKTEDE